MDLNLDLNLVQSQKILLTPKLKQALDILKMNSQELFEYVEEQLEANPVLEVLENDEYLGCSNFLTLNMENVKEGSHDSELLEETDEINVSEVEMATSRLSLKEYLLFQLHTSILDSSEVKIGEYLIDNIDENGYLNIELTEVAKYFNTYAGRVENVIWHIQSFEPSGICARSLKECLTIQLRQVKCFPKAAMEIVDNHLSAIAEDKVEEVAKSMCLEKEEVEKAFQFIRTLEPKPGREFYHSDNIKFVIPDIIIKTVGDKYEIVINEDAIPLININDYYRKVLNSDVDGEVKKFVSNKIDNAAWLIKCIEQRKNTVLKVAEFIIEKEIEFLKLGKKHIQPIDIKEIAEGLDMHESIISNTLSGKFIQSTWGLVDMSSFIK